MLGGECEWGRSGGEGNLQQPTTMDLYTSLKGHAGSVDKEKPKLAPESTSLKIGWLGCCYTTNRGTVSYFKDASNSQEW